MVREIVANELRKHSRNSLSPQQAPPQSFINKNSPQDKSQGLSEELKSFIEDLVSDKNRQIEDNLEDVKREFAMALNDAEDTSFQMNKKMLESIVANVDALENQVEKLKKDISVKSSAQQPAADIEHHWQSISKQIDCLRSSHDDLKDRVSRQITEIEEKVKIDGHSLQSIAKSLSVKADVSMVDQVKSTFDNKLASLDEKIADRQKMEGGGKLSYFLSPFEENAMSGRSYPHPQKFDKKKIPTINLNSIVVSDRLDQPRSRDLPPSKPDDSYTSFEEEFRFRLGKNKMGGKDEGNGVKLEDIKLSYVFSSNSKEGRDNLNLESEPLSRRLFDEEFKYSDRELINIKPMEQERLQMMKMPREFNKENYKEVERDYSIKKQGPKTQGNSAQITKRSDLPVANEEYSVILNNISNLSANSQAFMRQVVRQSGKKASSCKNQVAIAVEDQSENKENTNTSNSIRVIQDDAFDFEKWAKDNDLHISGFQL